MKTTLHNRLFIIGMMVTALAQNASGQYYQRQYNWNYTTHVYRHEYLESGICTKVNYTGSDTNKYFMTAIGTSLSNYTPLFSTETLYSGNRVRFIRNDRNGAVLNNKGYEFSKSNNTKWYNSEAYSIDEVLNATHNGGYVITGSVRSNSKTGSTVLGGSDILFSRLNSTGGVVASVSIDNASTFDVGYCVKRSTAPDVAGTYLLCGSVRKSSVRSDVFVARVNSAGSVLWFKTFNLDTTYSGNPPTAHNIAYSLVEIPSAPDIISSFWGEIHVVGTYQDATSANLNGFWLRLNKNGIYITSQRYFSPFPGAENDDVVFKSVKWTDDNNLVVTGYTNGLASGLTSGPHTLLVKLEPIGGGLLGTRVLIARDSFGLDTVPSQGQDVIERINSAGFPEYYISGFSETGFFSPIARNIVFRTDLSGFPIAQYLFAQSNYYGQSNSIDFVRGTLYRPGFTLFSSAINTDSTYINDSYIAKSYFNGCRCTNNCNAITPMWWQLNVPAAPTLLDTTITSTVTQLKSRAFTYKTILVCNQSTIAGGSSTREESEAGPMYEEMKLYPNPANDFINVNVTVNEKQDAGISVYDVSGKLVSEEFVQLEGGESQVKIDIEELPTGFYVLKLTGKQNEMRSKFLKQ